MATEIRTRSYTVYVINEEEYRSLRLLRKSHPELVFSSKADEKTLALVGITKEEKTVEYTVEVPDEETSETVETQTTEETETTETKAEENAE